MTTLANNVSIREYSDGTFIEDFPASVSAAQTIYKGVPLIIDQSVDATAVVTADGVTCVDGDVFMGIAFTKVVTTLNGPATKISTLYGPSVVGIPSTVFVIADAGKVVYASAFTATGITLSASNGAYPRLGKLLTVKDGLAWIMIEAPYVLDVP